MPYVSDAQRRFMHAKHPGIAKRWDKEYPNQKGLPEHVGDSEKKGEELPMNERVVDTIIAAGTALDRLEHDRQEKQAADEAYTKRASDIVKVLAQYGRIDDTEEEKQAMAQILANPLGALEVIEKLAASEPESASGLASQQVDAQGRPATQKRASYDSLNSPYVGSRRAADSATSWQNFERNLGLR